MSSLSLNGNTDARAWAEAFAVGFAPIFDGDETMPQDEAIGLLTAWFANAIETGRDAGHRAGECREREAIVANLLAEAEWTRQWQAASALRGFAQRLTALGASCTAALPTEVLECPKHPGQFGDH